MMMIWLVELECLKCDIVLFSVCARVCSADTGRLVGWSFRREVVARQLRTSVIIGVPAVACCRKNSPGILGVPARPVWTRRGCYVPCSTCSHCSMVDIQEPIRRRLGNLHRNQCRNSCRDVSIRSSQRPRILRRLAVRLLYVLGIAGCVWSVAWFLLCYDSPAVHPRISPAERRYWLSVVPRIWSLVLQLRGERFSRLSRSGRWPSRTSHASGASTRSRLAFRCSCTPFSDSTWRKTGSCPPFHSLERFSWLQLDCWRTGSDLREDCRQTSSGRSSTWVAFFWPAACSYWPDSPVAIVH